MINAFLMIGQSNMSGRGALDELPPLECPHAHVWREGAWQPAQEPIVRDQAFSGAGMGSSFAATLNALTGAEIGLIPCSLGGSPLSAWQPGEALFETAVAQSASALASGARMAGVLWHQGETDSEDSLLAHTYLKRLAPMMDELERRLRGAADSLGAPELVVEPLPVIVGELGDYLDGYPGSLYHRAINAQLHEFAQRRAQYACAAARDLAHKGDCLHFSTRAQRMLGVRYACAWAQAAERVGLSI